MMLKLLKLLVLETLEHATQGELYSICSLFIHFINEALRSSESAFTAISCTFVRARRTLTQLHAMLLTFMRRYGTNGALIWENDTTVF
jgi:hypothetical protein